MNRLTFPHIARITVFMLGLIASAFPALADSPVNWTAPVANQTSATIGSGVSYTVAANIPAGATITITKNGSYFASGYGGATASTSDVGPTVVTYNATATLQYYPYTKYSGSYTVTITSAAIQTSFSTTSSFVCDGTTKYVNVIVNPNNATYYTSGTWSATNVGSYTAGAQAYGLYAGSNYNLTWSITKGKAVTPSLAASSTSLGAGAPVTFTATGGSTNTYEWSGSASGNGNQKNITFANPGTYTISVRDPGSSNFDASDWASVTVTVNALPVSFSLSSTSFTYDGNSHSVSVSASPSSATYSVSGAISGTNANTYTVTVTGTGAYASAPNNLTWTINKANQSNPSLSPNNPVYAGSGGDTFSASGGATNNYSWACSSNASISGTGASRYVSFPSPGNYWVSVQDTGSSNYNASNTVYSSVTVNPTPASFSWKNGVPTFNFTTATYSVSTSDVISNPSGVTFTLTGAVSKSNAGTYTATASAYGAYSGSTNLTWIINKGGNSILASPMTINANPGAPISISASGGSTGGYVWSGMYSSTSTSVSFNAPTTPGTYYEYVYDGGNVNYNQSNTVTITINVVGAPTITTQPASQTVNAGTPVTFSVVASGSGTLSYQWKKGGLAIAGATNSSYGISNPQASDAGSYTVVVTNTQGSTQASVESSAAVLTVNSAPTITTQPASQTVNAGTPVTFSVVASGSGTLSYRWKKGGVAIAGATGSSYVISNPQSSDPGSYTVVVTNTQGGTQVSVESSAAVLIVNIAPTITSQPAASQTVPVGTASVSFTVLATGSPAPTYQWNKGGSIISGATAATYTITNVQTTHAGSYTVTVTNTAGSVTSSAATLIVRSGTVDDTTNLNNLNIHIPLSQ